jgi:hypothetical protein
MFENMAAMLDLSGAGSDALSPGSAVAAWTGAVWRQDSWWWLSTKQPADPSVFNWGLKFPVNAASAPAVMAYQQGQEWFMANMPAGSPGYALCQLPGECCAGAGVVEGASDGELCQLAATAASTGCRAPQIAKPEHSHAKRVQREKCWHCVDLILIRPQKYAPAIHASQLTAIHACPCHSLRCRGAQAKPFHTFTNHRDTTHARPSHASSGHHLPHRLCPFRLLL